MKQIISRKIVLITLGWFLAGPAGAVMLSYDAVVTFSGGIHSSLFPAGERVLISYTLDPLVADSNSDSQRGLFDSPVLSLSVSFVDLGIFANSGSAGRAQTFNNVVDSGSGRLSDQVFLFGGPISSASSLGGESINFLEVDFLSDFVTLPNEPSMLSSDALPLFELPIIDAFLFLGTSSGFTSVHFEESSQVVEPSSVALLMIGILALLRVHRHKSTDSGLYVNGLAAPLNATPVSGSLASD